MTEVINKGLGLGIVTIPADPELIPQQSSQDSLGWISTDGQIELCKGRLLIGAEETASGSVLGEGWGYTATGAKVHFRKINTKIQYYNTTTSLWVDVVTGLTASAEYTFSPYQSLAGTFVYATGVDGIYKIHTANPGSYSSMYNPVMYDSVADSIVYNQTQKNYAGYSMITQSRMSMWNVKGALTTHYLSYTDSAQDGTVYNVVQLEPTTSLTGTLLFKAGTFTVTIASPGVFTSATAHGYAANDPIIFSTTGALPTGLAAGTVYYVIATGLTSTTFQVSATLAGSAVNTSGTQSGVHSITDGARRTCFGVTILLTGSGETYTDDYSGNLTGSLGGTGTINYTTGAYTISNSGVGTANYSWEMTNNKGVTDFTYSATRTALQGDAVRQDEGGDAIKNIVFYNGTYYSFKEKSVYALTWANDGLSFENIVFRTNIGLPYWRSIVATSKGIIFIDNANADKPQLTILKQNITGDHLEPVSIANQFDFANYTWDNTSLNTFGEFIIFSGKSQTSSVNNKMFLYNTRRDTVDILPYGATTITSSEGRLYIGDTVTDNVYEILSGFDDNNETIENYWVSNDERYGSELLKRYARLRLKGLITPDQKLEVYLSYDNDDFVLVGTILGNGTYVDATSVYSIGSQGIGTAIIGGEQSTVDGSFYFAELKLTTPKFRKRSIKLKATGLGYVSVNMMDDLRIKFYEQRLVSKYRTKQNVSLDGTVTDISNDATEVIETSYLITEDDAIITL